MGRITNAQYFSTRGCAKDFATSTPLSTSQYKCPMPNTSLPEAAPTASLRDAVRVRSVQVPNAQCPIPLDIAPINSSVAV
ncbi:MAG: hypothetical protein V7K14_03270 [Nostoc sp.]|uniref:hypothetical protein n=1 Tax=Nostoc sp. TaxID=1180 RepID=UPI002FF851CE